MKERLNKIILKESDNFNSWIELINNYLEIKFREDNIQENEIWNRTQGCVDAFSKITELCIEYGRFKDKWDYNNFYINLYGPELIIKSLKTNCEYKIGIDNKGIYLTTDIRYSENIRYMGDDFWKLLLSFYKFEGFVYDEYEFVSKDKMKQFPELFSTNKSMVFRILRKYFFDSIETENNYVSSSVGELKIQFTINIDFEEIISNFCLAFKAMYQLNYSLWKITDLRNKNNGRQQKI